MKTPRQSWWEALQDPGVVPLLTEIRDLLESTTGSRTDVSSTTSTDRSVAGSTTRPFTQPMGFYPYFMRMTDLTDLLLSAGVSGIYPQHVQQVVSLQAGASNDFRYTPQPGYVLLAAGPLTIRSSEYSSDLHLNVYIDYQQADALQVVENVLVTEEIRVGQEVMGQTPMRYNVTAKLTNDTNNPLAVTGAISVVHIDQDVWRQYYQAYFEKFLPGFLNTWIKDVTT